MSIGLGIFLFVVGAIMVFALNFSVEWIDIELVGYILMGAGVVMTILGVVLITRKRHNVTTMRTVGDPGRGEQVTRRDNSVDGL